MSTAITNIEALYERAKKYTETSVELYKLNAIEKTADIFSSIVSILAIVMLVILFTLFVNISISLYIGELLGSYYIGFLILSAFYMLLAILFYFNKTAWIKTPLSNLIIALLQKTKKQ